MPFCILEAVLKVVEVLEVIRCVLFCMAEVLEVMRRVLLCMLEAAEGEFCLLEVLEVPEMLEVLEAMHRVLLCMLEAAEGELCLLEMLEVMRCVLLCIRRLWRVHSFAGGVGVDTMCAALYAGGRGR